MSNSAYGVWKATDGRVETWIGNRSYNATHVPGIDVWHELTTGLNTPLPIVTLGGLQADTGLSRPVMRQIIARFSFFASLPSASAPPSYVAGSYPEESQVFASFAASRIYLEVKAPGITYLIPVPLAGGAVEIPPLDFGDPSGPQILIATAGLPLAQIWDPVDPVTIHAQLQISAIVTEG